MEPSEHNFWVNFFFKQLKDREMKQFLYASFQGTAFVKVKYGDFQTFWLKPI